MPFLALVGLGILGLASGGIGGGAPISINAGAGAPLLGDFNAPVVRSPSVEPQAPAAPKIFVTGFGLA